MSTQHSMSTADAAWLRMDRPTNLVVDRPEGVGVDQVKPKRGRECFGVSGHLLALDAIQATRDLMHPTVELRVVALRRGV